MKLFNTSCALNFDRITLFSISSANATDCSSHTQKKAEIDCLSVDKKCLDAKEKQLRYKVEA